MHNTVPQMGHYYPQMGCPPGQMGHFYPQLGFAIYDEGMGYAPQMGAMGDVDITQALSDGLSQVFGTQLPAALKTAILNSAQGQQAVQTLANTAGTLTKEQAAAQAASYWTQQQQALTAQFNQLLNYTQSNYKRILTYIALAAGGAAALYFAWPVVKGMMKSAPAVAANPRRRRRRARR